jgi:hypothetical protein
MKKFNIFMVIFMVFSTCLAQNSSLVPAKATPAAGSYVYFGAQFADSNTISSGEMLDNYQKLSKSDTLVAKFSGKVTAICKVKGCWMKLQLGNGDETMVKFKDYGFFVSQELLGKEVIVYGLAYVEEMSVADQRHFAKDAGKSEEVIGDITAVAKTYAFEADGVLIKE